MRNSNQFSSAGTGAALMKTLVNLFRRVRPSIGEPYLPIAVRSLARRGSRGATYASKITPRPAPPRSRGSPRRLAQPSYTAWRSATHALGYAAICSANASAAGDAPPSGTTRVTNPIAIASLRVHETPAQDQVQPAPQLDDVRQPLRPAVDQGHAPPALQTPELRACARDAHIAPARDLQPARHAVPSIAAIVGFGVAAA